MEKVYLSLGSNIGDRVSFLNEAINFIKNNKYIENVEISSFYETDPRGYVEQDRFVNCVVSLKTDLEALDLLTFCQSIEKKLKRIRLFRWGPRTIDVDILLYGSLELKTHKLTIPHERMYERAFVLIPLSELDSSFLEIANKLESQGVNKLIN